MKKQLLCSVLLFLCLGKVAAQTEISNSSNPTSTQDSTQKDYVVELNNNTIITGKKVSDDGREVGIITVDKGLILIPKYQIKSITVAVNMPTVGGRKVFPNPHPSRYFYSPSGLPIKKGEGYFQSIYYLAFQGQYAITDNWSIGATSTLWASPLLLNVKYTNTLLKSTDGKRNLYLATGVQAGSMTYINPGTWLGVGYVGLTYGNAESNITINGGALGLSYMDFDGSYDPVTQRFVTTEFRTTEKRPAISVSWNQRVSSTACFMGEVWYVGNLIVGGPGMRFYAGRKNTIDVAIIGGYDVYWTSGIFGVPMISWTRKMGGK